MNTMKMTPEEFYRYRETLRLLLLFPGTKAERCAAAIKLLHTIKAECEPAKEPKEWR